MHQILKIGNVAIHPRINDFAGVEIVVQVVALDDAVWDVVVDDWKNLITCNWIEI